MINHDIYNTITKNEKLFTSKSIRVTHPSVILENDELVNWPLVLPTLEKILRTCYKSENMITQTSYEGIIKRVVHELHHESTIEHAVVMSFRIVCDRGVSHELVRHRIASFSQESTRYVNYTIKNGGQVILPIDLIDATKDELRFWYNSCDNAFNAYHNSIEKYGRKPQLARGFLPHFTKTEIIMTLNLRALRHFLKLRTAQAAHPDMRVIADMIYKIAKSKIDIIFDDIKDDHVTKQDCINAYYGKVFYHKTVKNADGSAARCRSNGKCKVWKTRPTEFSLPVKHGLKNCFYITQDNCKDWLVNEKI